MSDREPELLLVPRMRKTKLSMGEAWDFSRALAKRTGVVEAEPSFVAPVAPPTFRSAKSLSIEAAPADCEWSLSNARVQEAWELPTSGLRRGEGVVIGHPDTGYTRHYEIWSENPKDRRIELENAWDCLDGDPDPTDPLIGGVLRFPGHGTSTASVIMSDVGPTTNERFVSGVAPRAQLVPFRVSTSVVHLSLARVTEAIYRAIDAGCHVISMSLGSPFPWRSAERAVEAATNAGVIVCAAAGNYWPWVVWPAAFDSVLAVAATNVNDRPWKWSARGSKVALSAPGEDVWVARSLRKDAQPYRVDPGSGTSFAVACVAGVGALWLASRGLTRTLGSRPPELPGLFRAIVTGATRVPREWDSAKYGTGIVDAKQCLLAAVPVDLARGTGRTQQGSAGDRSPQLREQIQHIVQAADPRALERALASLLRTDASLDEVLDEVGDELIVAIALDPDLRKMLSNQPSPQTRASKTRRRVSPTKFLATTASSTLTRRLRVQ